WRRLVAEDRLPPVLLITGREGLGKRLLLAALAAMHVCETGVACGACAPCRLLQAGTHPELLWLESETGKLMIEDASALQEHVALSAARDVRARLAVMVDADQMTTQAANRLLKTL